MLVAHCRTGPSNGSAAGDRLLRRAQRRPLLGQHHELGTGSRGLAGETVCGFEIAVPVRGRLQLNGGGTHERFSFPTAD